MFDLSKFNGAGRETIDPRALGAPILDIIQTLSPEINPAHPKHKERKLAGAGPGDILFAPSRNILIKYDSGKKLKVIVLGSATVYTEWKPRKSGGGWVANHPLSIVQNPNYRHGQKGTDKEKKEYLGENDLILTHTFAVRWFSESEGQWFPGIINLSGGGLKASRQWMRMLLTTSYPEGSPHSHIKPPLFGAVWNLSAYLDNRPGGSFFNWEIALDGMLDPVDAESSKLLTESSVAYEMVADMLPKLGTASTPQIADTAIEADDGGF